MSTRNTTPTCSNVNRFLSLRKIKCRQHSQLYQSEKRKRPPKIRKT